MRVEGEVVGSIGRGWAILLGIGPNDDAPAMARLADRIAGLRVFADAAGKMNLSAADVGAEFLVVSQFTLYADTSRGRRPGFTGAAPPAVAEALVERWSRSCAGADSGRDRRFGADMAVELVNDGPVTIVLGDDWA